jgi:hypothetical protein
MRLLVIYIYFFSVTHLFSQVFLQGISDYAGRETMSSTVSTNIENALLDYTYDLGLIVFTSEVTKSNQLDTILYNANRMLTPYIFTWQIGEKGVLCILYSMYGEKIKEVFLPISTKTKAQNINDEYAKLVVSIFEENLKIIKNRR